MAEVLASLKKIGGNGEQYTETVLWTNPSPSSNFAAQTITLSDSLSNYKYIGIRFKIHNTHASTPNATGIMLVSEFVQNKENTGTDRRNILVASQNTNNATMARNAWYVSDTSIKFSVAYQLSSTNTNTSYVIPLEILGINELKGGSGLKTPFVFVVRCPQSTSYGQSVMLAENYNQYTYMRTMSQAEVNSWWGRTDITVSTSVTLSESSGTTTIQETTLTTSPVLISSLNFVDTNMIWAQVRGTACAIMLYD